MNYIVVKEMSVKDLCTKVNEGLARGCELRGELVISCRGNLEKYHQVMVKKGAKNDNNN